MKKLLLTTLSALLLVGCATNTTESYKIIEPVSRGEVAVLDEAGTAKVSEYYGNETSVTNFTLVGSELLDADLERYDGSTINLANLEGKTVVEYVANWCTYCNEQEKSNIDAVKEVLEENGINFVQVFVQGTKEEVDAFMQTAGKEALRNNPVIANDEMYSYAEKVGIPGFPSIVFYDEEHKARWIHVGLTPAEEVEKLLKVAYDEDPLYNHLAEQTTTRTIEDLKADLGEEFVNKVSELSSGASMEYNAYMNMGYPLEMSGEINTLEVGKTINFDNLKENTAFVFLLAANEDENLKTTNEYFIQTMNIWSEEHPEVDVVWLMIEYDVTPAAYLKELTEQPKGYLLNANDESIPKSMYNIQLYDAPSIVFYSAKDKVLTGGYIGDINKEKIEGAYQLFKDAYKIKEGE